MMKLIKKLLAVLLLIAVLATSVGCYMISGQKINDVKGTYKLTHYSRTPEYERREGYTPKTINYVEDEAYQFEDYLIVTGTSTGYYVHKDAKNPAYVKEITLSYLYDEENSSKVEYVIYNDALSVNKDSGINKLGVTKNHLSYSKPAFDYTQLFTGKKMRSEDISVRWEKVDRATDLSYVQKQLGSLKTYTYQAFGVRGIYELDDGTDITTETLLEGRYQYFYYVVDTAENVTTVTAYFALKETPTEQKVETLSFSHEGGEFSSFTIDGRVWTVDPSWKTRYTNEKDGVRYVITCRASDISSETLESMINSRLPVQE